MRRPARPTLRCLGSLGVDWEDVEQADVIKRGGLPRSALHELAHPIIRHAAAVFTGESEVDAQRESISGMTNPAFWKVKTGQWRGAVWIDKNTEQAWLCAVGLRRAGSDDDFYAAFMRAVESEGADAFVPTADDLARLALEDAHDALRTWELALYLLVVRAVRDAMIDGVVVRALPNLHPDAESPATIEVAVERVAGEWALQDAEEEPVGIAIQLSVRDWSDVDVLSRIQIVACSAISPCEQDWDVSPDALGVRLMATISEARLRRLGASADLDPSLISEKITVNDVAPVTHAHYAKASAIAEASIDGIAVRGMCGVWFVPRQDHAGMPACADCENIYQTFLDSRPDPLGNTAPAEVPRNEAT